MSQSKETKATKDFIRGFTCACATMILSHGESTPLTETFQTCFKDEAQLRECGVEESDIEALRPVIDEINRRRKNNT